MLSDYLFTGVVVGAAMLSLGSLARALPAGSASPLDERRGLMVLLAAFVEGLGVLAITYGMAVLFVDTSGAGTTAGLAILLPAAAAGVVAVLFIRPGQRDGVRAPMTLMLTFIGALAALAVILALLAWLVSENDASGFDIWTVLATAVMAAGALGIGLVGSRGLGEMSGGTGERPGVDAGAVRSRTLLMAAVFEGVAIVAYVVVMLIFFMRD